VAVLIAPRKCDHCGGEVFRPITAWGRLFCEIGCEHAFRTQSPNIVAGYRRAYPRGAA
jgi:fructosamine-3-kinase